MINRVKPTSPLDRITAEYLSKHPSADPAQIKRHAQLGHVIAHQTAPGGTPTEKWLGFCIQQQITRYLSTIGKPAGTPKVLPPAAQRRENVLVDAFVTKYLPLVEAVVFGLRARLPKTFETADLISAGKLGLVIAARTVPSRIDPATFDAERWARWCIRRQILNEVCGPSTGRPLGDGKRNQQTGAWVQSKVNSIAEEGPYLSFLQQDTGVPSSRNGRAAQAATASATQPEYEARPIYYRGQSALRQVNPPAPPDPEDTVQADRLAVAIGELPPRQRKLIKLMYQDGRSLRVVGRKKLLGIGWRRVRNEHDAAIRTLRETMQRAA